jgi:hypothetical protein
MTASMQIRADFRPPAIPEAAGHFVELAAVTGAGGAACTAAPGRDDTVVAESVRALQTSGSTRLTIPADPDSLGATLRLVGHIQAALVRSRDARLLAANTHRLVMLLTVDSQRRVASVGLTLTASGAAVGPGRRELPPH